MKKALFFMIFIFATAICGYAQETNVAEQNDDKTLDSCHQNRRTMRGYKAFYDVEYGFDSDLEVFYHDGQVHQLADAYHRTRKSLLAVFWLVSDIQILK